MDSPPLLGSPPRFDAVTAVWLAGSAVLNGVVCLRLIPEVSRHVFFRPLFFLLSLVIRQSISSSNSVVLSVVGATKAR